MTISWTLADVPGGTEVTILCENVPEGIRPNDHEMGLRSTLEIRCIHRVTDYGRHVAVRARATG
jgi:hypothetical protein